MYALITTYLSKISFADMELSDSQSFRRPQDRGLREAYLNGDRGDAPAAGYLGRTRPVYEFIRVTLGVKMHGRENASRFEKGLGVEDVSIGQHISLIHEVRFHSLTFYPTPW